MTLGAQQRAFAIGANGLRHHAAFTLDAYAENVHALAGALAAAGCRVALVTLPPIGEDLDSAVNTRVSHIRVPHDTMELSLGVNGGTACSVRNLGKSRLIE